MPLNAKSFRLKRLETLAQEHRRLNEEIRAAIAELCQYPGGAQKVEEITAAIERGRAESRRISHKNVS